MRRWGIFALCLAAVMCFAGDEIFSPWLILQLPEQLTITAVALSPGAEHVAAGTYEGKVLVWSLRAQNLVLSFETDGTTLALAFSSDGSFVFSCSASGKVYRADLLTQEVHALFEAFSFPLPVYPPGPPADRPLMYVETGQAMAAFSPQAAHLATSAFDGWIRIHEVSTGRFLADFAPLGPRAWEQAARPAFSPCGRYLGLCVQGKVWSWRVDSAEIHMLPLEHLFVSMAAVGPEGRLWALATETNELFLFSLDEKDAVPILSLSEMAKQLAFLPDGNHIMVATEKTIKIVSTAEKSVIQEWRGLRPLALSLDGKYLVHVDADGARLVVRVADRALGE